MLRSRGWLVLSLAIGATYLGYVVWSKFARTLGPPPFKLSETQEFLLFLAAIVAFVGQVIVEERRRTPSGTHEGADR